MRYADNSIVSNSGSPFRSVLGPKVKSDGTIEVCEIGKEDFDAYIQSFKDSTDISFILAKLAQGDTSVLNQRMPNYGDFTQVPHTFAEILQLQIDAATAFGKLPPDVKSNFNNDVNQWMAQAGNESWYDNMKDFVSRPVSEVIEKQSDSNMSEVSKE